MPEIEEPEVEQKLTAKLQGNDKIELRARRLKWREIDTTDVTVTMTATEAERLIERLTELLDFLAAQHDTLVTLPHYVAAITRAPAPIPEKIAGKYQAGSGH